MSADSQTRACIATPTACCTSCAGGRAFTTPATSRRQTSLNRPCSITCDSSPVGNLAPSATTINDRVATADRAIRNEFPDAPCQVAQGFHQPFLHRRPMGLGRPRFELSRLRVKEPKLTIVPLSVDEVARFWSSFRNARDLAIVGLMLMHGLRSAEVLALIRTTCCFPKVSSACAARAASCASSLWRRRPRN